MAYTQKQAKRDIESAIQFLEMTLEDEPDAHVPLLPGPLNADDDIADKGCFSNSELRLILNAIQEQLGTDPEDVLSFSATHGYTEFSHPKRDDIALYAVISSNEQPTYFLGLARSRGNPQSVVTPLSIDAQMGMADGNV